MVTEIELAKLVKKLNGRVNVLKRQQRNFNATKANPGAWLYLEGQIKTMDTTIDSLLKILKVN